MRLVDVEDRVSSGREVGGTALEQLPSIFVERFRSDLSQKGSVDSNLQNEAISYRQSQFNRQESPFPSGNNVGKVRGGGG